MRPHEAGMPAFPQANLEERKEEQTRETTEVPTSPFDIAAHSCPHSRTLPSSYPSTKPHNGAAETALWVKRLSWKREDLGLDPQSSRKKLGLAVCTFIPSRDERVLGLVGQPVELN